MRINLLHIAIAAVTCSGVAALLASPPARASDRINCSGLKTWLKATSDGGNWYHEGDKVFYKGSSVWSTGGYRCKGLCVNEPEGHPGEWEFLGMCESFTEPH
ncbi:MAG TPA: hypothetical protein VHW23_28295 [Kofleriaceae bacterium]|jgi:hypothetical protein|nr:hypothetical protein [Kofleriaceae bacterium]